MKSKERSAAHAADLHKQAIVIDCHCDILMPISDGYVRLAQDIQPPDPRTLKLPFEIPAGSKRKNGVFYYNGYGCIGQYSLPQFISGGLTAQVCAVFVSDEDLDHALKKCMEMVYWFHREIEENEKFQLVTTVEDIYRMKREKKCGGILALEGLEPLGTDIKMLDILYKLGLRMAGLTHNRRNYFAEGTQDFLKTGGLTPIGKQAIRRMNELGIVVDLGHLDQGCYWDVLKESKAPVVLSHRSPKAFFPPKPEESWLHPRYDVSGGRERLEALAKNGGVFGVFFLKAKDVDAVVADIEYMMDVAGPDHVGLGSDLYGLVESPVGLEDIGKVHNITTRLVERGHSDEVILKFLGGNYMRVFEKVWKKPPHQ